MRRTVVGSIASLTLLASTASAQFAVGSGWGVSTNFRAGFGYGVGGRYVGFTAGNGYYGASYSYGYAVRPYNPWLWNGGWNGAWNGGIYSYSPVGYGPAFGGLNLIYIAPPPQPVNPLVIMPQVVINNPPVGREPIVIAPRPPRDDNDMRPRAPRPRMPVDDEPLPGAPAGRFRPMEPRERPPVAPKKPDDLELFLPEKGVGKGGAENAARISQRGREALADGEYGRAADRFRRATAANPDDPLAHLLLAQSLFALGKYAEAVQAIDAGLTLKPNLAKDRFRPRDLYGPHVADFTDQLDRLDSILAKHPRDGRLLFLFAYQIWFDGRQDEARRLLQRALELAPDLSVITKFLQAWPANAEVATRAL
jgi:hypothetical protein